MIALFGAGGVLLVLLSPMALLAGFLIPFGVLVLKAVSTLLLESRAWKWLTASPWRSAMVVAAILVAAWWVVPSRLTPPAIAQHGNEPAAPQTADPHASPADPHAATSTPRPPRANTPPKQAHGERAARRDSRT